MQTEIRDAVPAARSVAAIRDRRVRCHSSDSIAIQYGLCSSGEPRGVPWLADYGSVVARPHEVEESRDCPRLQRERGGKLHQQRPTVRGEAIRLREKSLEWSAGTSELQVMGDEPRRLYGKPKLARR